MTGLDVQEWSELDKGQVENIDREIRRAVEAKRKEQQEQTTAHEQGKKVSFFTNKEKEAQEAQEWQELFMESRSGAQEARVEEWREQEKRSENDEDEWVPVVPNMESGSSYLRTTYPRDQVEKIVMDGLEERQTGRESDGLVRGEEYRCQPDETSRKGKRKRDWRNGRT